MTLTILDAEYPGDPKWENFVSAILSMPGPTVRCVVRPFASCDEKMALVLSAIMGDHASSWMNSPCRALEMRTPLDVLQNDLAALKIVRHLLMRMP